MKYVIGFQAYLIGTFIALIAAEVSNNWSHQSPNRWGSADNSYGGQSSNQNAKNIWTPGNSQIKNNWDNSGAGNWDSQAGNENWNKNDNKNDDEQAGRNWSADDENQDYPSWQQINGQTSQSGGWNSQNWRHEDSLSQDGGQWKAQNSDKNVWVEDDSPVKDSWDSNRNWRSADIQIKNEENWSNQPSNWGPNDYQDKVQGGFDSDGNQQTGDRWSPGDSQIKNDGGSWNPQDSQVKNDGSWNEQSAAGWNPQIKDDWNPNDGQTKIPGENWDQGNIPNTFPEDNRTPPPVIDNIEPNYPGPTTGGGGGDFPINQGTNGPFEPEYDRGQQPPIVQPPSTGTIGGTAGGTFPRPEVAGGGTRGDTGNIPAVFPERVPQGNYKGSAHGGTYPGDDPSQWRLEDSIPGTPGVDYPNFSEIPKTSFNCKDHEHPGYYGDVEARCQVFHICQMDGRHNAFLCPLGTIFNQQYFVCDWYFNFDCSETPNYYALNADLYKPGPNGNYKGEHYPGGRTTGVFGEGFTTPFPDGNFGDTGYTDGPVIRDRMDRPGTSNNAGQRGSTPVQPQQPPVATIPKEQDRFTPERPGRFQPSGQTDGYRPDGQTGSFQPGGRTDGFQPDGKTVGYQPGSPTEGVTPSVSVDKTQPGRSSDDGVYPTATVRPSTPSQGDRDSNIGPGRQRPQVPSRGQNGKTNWDSGKTNRRTESGKTNWDSANGKANWKSSGNPQPQSSRNRLSYAGFKHEFYQPIDSLNKRIGSSSENKNPTSHVFLKDTIPSNEKSPESLYSQNVNGFWRQEDHEKGNVPFNNARKSRNNWKDAKEVIVPAASNSQERILHNIVLLKPSQNSSRPAAISNSSEESLAKNSSFVSFENSSVQISRGDYLESYSEESDSEKSEDVSTKPSKNKTPKRRRIKLPSNKNWWRDGLSKKLSFDELGNNTTLSKDKQKSSFAPDMKNTLTGDGHWNIFEHLL